MGGIFGVLLGVGVTGFILAAALGIFDQASTKWERTDTISLLSVLRMNVQRDYANAGSYGNNTNLVAALDSRGSIPDNARRVVGGTTQIHHPMGGEVRVVGGPGGVGTQYRITLRGLNNEDCAAIGDEFVGQSATRSRLVSVVMNGSTVAAPVTRAQLTTGCNGGQAANNIGFIFR